MRRVRLVTIWCMALSPLWLLLAVVGLYGVDVPRLDEWEVLPQVFRPWYAGGVDGAGWCSHLFAQANESRPAVPRVIILALGVFTRWNIKWEMLVTVGLAAANLGLMALLYQKTSGRAAGPAVVFLAALAIFSPWQREFLFGYQMANHLPLMFILLALLAVESEWKLGWVTMAALGCCVAATFSYANGMLAWPLIFVYAAARRGRMFYGRVWGVVLLLAFVGTVAGYFVGYQKPAHHPGFVVWRWDFVPALLGFFGAPLGALRQDRASFVLAATCGAAVLALLGWAAFLEIRRGPASGPAKRDAALPLLVVEAYVIVSGLAATAGRLGMGNAMVWASTRYGCFSTYLWAAVVFLCARNLTPRRLVVGLAVTLVMVEVVAYAVSIRALRVQHEALVRMRAALMVADRLEVPEIIPLIEFPGEQARLMRNVAEAHRYGLLRPVLAPDAFAPRPAIATSGMIERLTIREDQASASGTAFLPTARPADAVFVTALANAQTDVVAVGFPNAAGGWRIEFKLPSAATGLHAWAVDGKSGATYPLGVASGVDGAVRRDDP